MQKQPSSRFILFAVLFWLVGHAPLARRVVSGQSLNPIVYTLRFPSPENHYAEVEVIVPAARRDSVELMMPVWSPGFYRVEDYAARVKDFSARTIDGKPLAVEHFKKNRWRVETGGASKVLVNYRLFCNSRSVTTNWVGDDLAVLNGPATFVTLAERVRRPHEVRLELPAKWNRAMSGLDAAPGGSPNRFRAPDFDTLVDSPIVAGDLSVREFIVGGSKHYVVDAGENGHWDGQREAQDLERIVRETRRFWGFLPFNSYVFLNVFRQGGGGLEHKNSTLLTSSPRMAAPNFRWLSFVSHEYFHAFNVKRLRPVELGPFDYENPPRTGSLWVSEGLTSYYGELLVCRAGLGKAQDCLAALSSYIGQLQNSPGRQVQTLEEASLNVWNYGTSGVGQNNATTVSYYVKGPIVGFLLDAKIRRATGGRKSLDDVMRLAYKRYAGERGFTPDEFRTTAQEVAGVDLKEWFRRAISSTEELDYSEALDWFGLRLVTSDGQPTAANGQPGKVWKLELREDATAAQTRRFQNWLGQTGKETVLRWRSNQSRVANSASVAQPVVESL